MFEKLAHEIPLHEAASYFIKLKSFEKVADMSSGGGVSYAPPDETGQLEGQFAAPLEQVIAQMAKMVQNELKTQYAYMTYANSLRGHSHFAIADEFENHAHMETEHADWLLRRMAVLGGPVQVPDIPAPPAATEAEDILPIMVRMEQEGIENWRILRQMIGDENPSKFKVEEFLTREQEHLDELWQMMPEDAGQALLQQQAGSAPATTLPPMPGKSEPDINESPKEPEAQGMKTAAVRIERCHPDTLHQHGEAMKLALMSGGTRGTTIVPEIGLDGVMKTASARMKSAIAKLADGADPPPLPPTAMGQQQAPPPPPPLSGPAAGQVMKTAYYTHHYGYGDPYGMHDLHAAQMARSMREREEVEALQGRMRRAPDDNARDRLAQHLIGQKTNEGAVGGAVGGSFGGALLGGTIGHAIHKPVGALVGGVLGGLGGGFLGHHLGKGSGKLTGEQMVDRAYAGELKTAEKFKAAIKKLALSEGTVPAGTSQTPAVSDEYGTPEKDAPQLGMPPQAPQMDEATAAYLQQEQAGQQAEQQAQENFYKERFQAASQQLQQLQQQAQSAQQQLDQFQQGQAQMMQQNQAIQQAAMQNAQAAHAAATQAMQQSLSAQKETINQQQLSVGMRDAVYAMRQAMMQQIQTELPPATTAEANAMAIDQSNAAQQQVTAGQTEQPADMNAQSASGGQDNSQQPGAAGQEQPKNTSGQPSSAGEEQPPNSPAPGGAGPEDSPSRGEGKEPLMTGAEPQGEKGQSSGQPPISVKVGSSEDMFVNAIMGKTSSLRGGLIGGGLGALAGGLAGFAESRSSNDPLRKKVQDLEERDRSGGGFVSALDLAQAKARLALGEFAERHPAANTALSAAVGAGQGASLGHHLSQ